jgi:ankyrin repeat protein
MDHVDLFGADSDTTTDNDSGPEGSNNGVQDVQPAAVVEPPPPPPPTVGRALFARAVSGDTEENGGGGGGGGGGAETKSEDTPSLPPPASSAAQPVKTLPRPVYDGDKLALIELCGRNGSGDVDEARDLIARGINIDERDECCDTALMSAAANKRLEVAQELIRAGAALDVQNNNDNETALIYAAANDRLEIVQELIRAGAALDVQNNNGRTALIRAAYYSHLEIAQELIRAGAALDVQNNNGETALQIARQYEYGYTEIVTLLEKAEAAAAATTGSVNDEADECAGEGKARELEEGEGEDAQQPHPLSSAAQPVTTLPRPAYEGDKEALINLCEWDGSGDVDEARDLIARGINIDEQDKYGRTALMKAASNNHLEITQELIRAGAALDLQDKYGKTAIIQASATNRLEMVQELINAGAALDMQDEDGETAQQIAEYGSTEIATLLEKAEAAAAAAGSANDEAEECAGGGRAGEKEGERKDEDPPPPPSSAAQPVKTLPRPVYDGDKLALINLCGYGGSGDVDEARDLIARGINIDEQDKFSALYPLHCTNGHTLSHSALP